MSNEDWYRNNNWDSEISEFFESKLKRSRGRFNKAQYLRIQGGILIQSENKDAQKAGVNLLSRVTDDFLDQEYHSYYAFEQLGDYYARLGELDKAISCFEKVVDYYNRDRNGTSGIADIKLAEALVESEKEDKYEYIISLLTDKFVETEGKLDFKDEIFRYHLVLSKVYFALNQTDLAKERGQSAIKALNQNDSPFPQHPKLGLAKPNDSDIAFLEFIIK